MHFGNSDVDLANPDHVEQLRRVFRSANAHEMAVVLDQILPEAPDVGIQQDHLNRVVTRVRQLGLDRVRLPFTDAEFRAIAGNVAPYMK